MKRTPDEASPSADQGGIVPREAIEGQLTRILESKRFAGSGRLKSLLTFIVTQYLKGGEVSLKETVIGIEVFGRPAGYDPQSTSIVRTTAQRLRAELTAYYDVDGEDDPIVITLPKGHYRPHFLVRTLREDAIIDSGIGVRSMPKSGLLRERWVTAFCTVAIVVLIGVFMIAKRHYSVVASVFPIPRTGRLFARATSETRNPMRFNVGHHIGWLLATPDSKNLYAIELFGRTVTVLGMEDLQVKRRFELPHAASGAVMSRDGKHLYIGSPENTVMILETENESVQKVIATGGPVFDLAVTPDGQKLFLAMGRAGLKRILLSSREVRSISEFSCPMYLNIDGEGQRLFVSYQCGGPGGRRGHDVLEIYDAASEHRVGVIRDLPMVGGPPVVSPHGDLVLLDALDACVSDAYDRAGCPEVPSHVFYLMRVSDQSVVKSFARPRNTFGAAFSPDGTRLIFGGDPLVVIDWAKQTKTEVAPIQHMQFQHFAFSPNGDRTFVASDEGGAELLVFDGEEPGCGPFPQSLANQYSGDGTLDDSIGVSALTAVGAVQFAPGLIGQAFQFNGMGTVLVGDEGAACWPCTGDWTESFFTKFDSIDGEMTLLELVSARDRWGHRLFKARDNRIKFQAGPHSDLRLISSSTPTQLDKWYHVALVAENSRRSLYVNGVLQGQVDLGEPIESSKPMPRRGLVLLGGSRGKRASLTGLLDEIAWYERALNAGEVMNLANARSRSTCAP